MTGHSIISRRVLDRLVERKLRSTGSIRLACGFAVAAKPAASKR